MNLECKLKTRKSKYNSKCISFKQQNKEAKEADNALKSMPTIEEKPHKNHKKKIITEKATTNDGNKENYKDKNGIEKSSDNEKLHSKMKVYVPYDNFYSVN